MIKPIKTFIIILTLLQGIICLDLRAQNQHLFSELKFKTPGSSEVHVYYILTKSGAVYIGELLGVRHNKLSILTEDTGRLELQVDQIQQIDAKGEGQAPEYSLAPKPGTGAEPSTTASDESGESYTWFQQMPGSGRYFFSPTAYNMKRGTVELRGSHLLTNNGPLLFSGSYGVSNDFSVSGGLASFGSAENERQLLYYFMPKYSFDVTQGWRMGTQLIFVTEGTASIGLFSLSSSFGNVHRNFGIGLSYGIANGEVTKLPFFNLAGTYRVSRRVSLVMDNYFVTGDVALNDRYTLGVRLNFMEHAIDIGLSTTNDSSFPYLNYTLRL